MLSKFEDNTKLGAAVDSLEGREALKGEFKQIRELGNHQSYEA